LLIRQFKTELQTIKFYRNVPYGSQRTRFFVNEYVFRDGKAVTGCDDRSNGDVAWLRKLPDGDGKLTADLS